MKTIPGQLDYGLLAQSIQPSRMGVTEIQVHQLMDARYACLQAAAALSCVAAGATDAMLECEAKRLHCTVAACADELAVMCAVATIST